MQQKCYENAYKTPKYRIRYISHKDKSLYIFDVEAAVEPLFKSGSKKKRTTSYKYSLRALIAAAPLMPNASTATPRT